MILLACFLVGTAVITGNVIAYGMGPTPNSGDCIPDGSGFDSPNGPNGEADSGECHGEPAPNSGDGVPDGQVGNKSQAPILFYDTS